MDLRNRERMLASQDEPGDFPLERDASAGIELTIIAT